MGRTGLERYRVGPTLPEMLLRMLTRSQVYHEQQKLPYPTYDEKQTERPPFLFACTVTLPKGPPSALGTDNELYPSKSLAKKAAARQAVMWLRSQGRLLHEATNIGGAAEQKRRKSDLDVATGPGHTGLTQALNEADVNAPTNISLPQQVNALIAAMGFSQPSWEMQPSKSFGQPGAFVDLAARFTERDVQREPRLAGSVGKVERVFGKKAAKDACCRELLRVLEDIQRSRST